MKTVVYGLIASLFVLLAFALTRQPVIVQSTSPSLPTAAPTLIAVVPTSAPQVIQPNATKAVTAMVTAAVASSTTPDPSLAHLKKALQQEPFKTDYNERTPELDWQFYQRVTAYSYRQDNLFYLDPIFRHFYAIGIQSLPIVQQLIEQGVVVSSNVTHNAALNELISKVAPHNGMVCSAEQCLILWSSTAGFNEQHTSEICNLVNEYIGRDCRFQAIADQQVTPKQYSEAVAYCHLGFEPSPSKRESLGCMQVLLAPTIAITFNHEFDETPELRPFYSIAHQQMQSGGITEKFTMVPVDYAALENQARNKVTFWQPNCTQLGCRVTVTHNTINFEPFDFNELAEQIFEPPFRSHGGHQFCQDVTQYSNNAEEPEWVNGQYICFPPPEIQLRPAQNMEHILKIWQSLAEA